MILQILIFFSSAARRKSLMRLYHFRICRNGFFLIALSVLPGWGQQISDTARQQIRDVLRIKDSLSEGQRKLSSDLLFSGMAARNEHFGAIPNSAVKRLETDSNGSVLVDMKVHSLAPVLQQISNIGGELIYSSESDGAIRAKLPLLTVEWVAGLPEVQWIRSADLSITNSVRPLRPFSSPSPFAMPHLAPFIGAVTSQGYVTHTADQAVYLGFDGTGVRVGALSDSASPESVAALIATGDLPPDVVTAPGQAGSGGDEGTAMMEIIHDLAPGAKLFFATANPTQDNFADNIRRLRFIYGCDIIVDDITYYAEGAFQDGVVAQAVNDVVADGALYFSSAANSGNLTDGTSGTWEGDFNDGGDAEAIIDTPEGQAVVAHNFGTADSPQNYDVLTGNSTIISLKWSDPLGASTNDYDLFILNRTGTAIKAFSINSQTGTQDPYEQVSQSFSYGDRIVVVRRSGVQRAIRIDTNRGRLSIGTVGSTFGHNAGLNTVTVAATAWNSAHNGMLPFTGFANPVETFSSDGPRKIFYNPDGSAITPGNYLFETNGGTNLQKPDLTAADGVFTESPGYLPFFGTSAAAPHAAAIAALVKSAHPSLTNAQVKEIMTSTALDTMAPGMDRDSGYGITMALPAVQAALSH
jgi:Subtilase family